jgi:hypothetical protein
MGAHLSYALIGQGMSKETRPVCSASASAVSVDGEHVAMPLWPERPTDRAALDQRRTAHHWVKLLALYGFPEA